MKIRIIFAGILLLLSLFLFVACEESFVVNYDGRELSVKELEALFDAQIESEEEETGPVPIRFGEGDVPEDDRLYWTEGGSVWHTAISCGHLSGQSDIYYGTQEEAISEGKTRGCSYCEKNDNK